MLTAVVAMMVLIAVFDMVEVQRPVLRHDDGE
jgi:hypothetical protein